jgi:hypothetical protein
MAHEIKKFDIGQKIIINTINIEGYITGIMTRENNFIEYEVSYYLGDNYYITNFAEYQIRGI